MQDPRIYTEEEIELFLHGDRREIDRLLLTSTNAVAAALISFRDEEFRPHAEVEQVMMDALGAPTDVLLRRNWLDLQIKREMEHAEFRKKIFEASVFWVLPILLSTFFVIFGTGLRDRLIAWLSHPIEIQQIRKDPK